MSVRSYSGSTEAKSDTANGMDQRVGLAAVDFPANAADIDIDDIGRWIKVQIPYMLQKHRSRDHLADIASQIFQQFKLSWQEFNFLAASASNPRQKIELQVADAQDRLLDCSCAAAGERIDPRK